MKQLVPILVLSGCFYTDTLNQRPSLDIHQSTTGETFRGSMLHLSAIANDPDGDDVTFKWRVYACTDSAANCDAVPFFTGTQQQAVFAVPMHRTESAFPLTLVSITLEGEDQYGATAKPSQSLVIPLGDQAPSLQLSKDVRHAYVINNPVNLFAKVGDADDALADLQPLEWVAFSPSPSTAQFGQEIMLTSDDANFSQFSRSLTPDVLGDWDIQVTAKDAQSLDLVQHLALHVDADHAPCLAQWDPVASSTPAETIPITDPTLFQVLVVEDDLDPFPSLPNDPVLGTTKFEWSIVPPGGSRQTLTGVSGSGVGIDPASYTPGDIVELRVEIKDRIGTTVGCPQNQLSCSTISDPQCTQRLSWEIEIR